MNNNTEQVFIINHSQEFETKDESELGTGQINLESKCILMVFFIYYFNKNMLVSLL